MPPSWTSWGVDVHLEPDPALGRRAGLEAALRAAIRDRRLAPGSLLPSSRALAAELGLARGTVTAAYGQLVEEAYLTSRPGSGTRVADVAATAAGADAAGPSDRLPVHDLRPNLPDLQAFPARAWLAATRRVLNGPVRDLLGPGDPQGRPELRTALADYLGRTRGVRATPGQIVVTSGFFPALGLLGRLLTERAVRTVATEDPGHAFYRGALERAGLRSRPLPVDGSGARVEDLPDDTADSDDTDDVGAVMVTPAHQYPTGVPLHPSRRHRLVEWAHDTGGLVIEDDYDGEFRYDRKPVGALQGLAPDAVVYAGTTSKTLTPALRLAWLVVPPRLVGPIVDAKLHTDMYTESLGQLVLAELIAGHAYERHVRACKLRYRRRREALLSRLTSLPRFTPHGVPAGLHTLVTNDRIAEPDLLAACAERGIALRGLAELYHRPAGRSGLLVGFAAAPDHAFPAALDALSAALAQV